MLSHSPTSPTNTFPPTEDSLRAELAAVLERTRVCMAAMPDLDSVDTREAVDRTVDLVDTAAALVGEAVQLNDALRSLDGLTVASALASGGVTVALAAVADALCIVQARLDGRSAA